LNTLSQTLTLTKWALPERVTDFLSSIFTLEKPTRSKIEPTVNGYPSAQENAHKSVMNKTQIPILFRVNLQGQRFS